eukprot:9463604-Lingulodinium_polyedra.AAC.1
MVRECTGAGLEQFRTSKTPGLGPLPSLGPPRTLHFNIDQHSVGWSAILFLKGFLHLQVDVVADPSHRVANDLNLALGGAGFWEVVLVSSIAFNLHVGPFQGAAWWRHCQEAGQEFLLQAKENGGDALLHAFLPRIAQERGETQRLTDP